MNESTCIGVTDPRDTISELRAVLSAFPRIELVIVFGSVARGRERPDSDVDIAVAARRALSVEQKIALIEAMAERTGRPIDLIDLRTIGEPLLGQILRHGQPLGARCASIACSHKLQCSHRSVVLTRKRPHGHSDREQLCAWSEMRLGQHAMRMPSTLMAAFFASCIRRNDPSPDRSGFDAAAAAVAANGQSE
jgi:predicted nucleotidyltransferase